MNRADNMSAFEFRIGTHIQHDSFRLVDEARHVRWRQVMTATQLQRGPDEQPEHNAQGGKEGRMIAHKFSKLFHVFRRSLRMLSRGREGSAKHRVRQRMQASRNNPASSYGHFFREMAIIAVAVTASVMPYELARAADGTGNQDLKVLRKEIETRSKELEHKRARHERLGNDLRAAEAHAAVVVKRLRQLETSLTRKSQQLESLRTQAAAREQATKIARTHLGREVRASFVLGRTDYVKILLNQGEPRLIAKALSLHGYVARARAGRISSLLDELARLASIEETIKTERDALNKLAVSTRAARGELDVQRARREQTLAALSSDIISTADQVAELRKNAERLSRITARVIQRSRSRPLEVAGIERAVFSAMRGKLSWPTRGRMAASFGAPRGASEIRSTGVVLRAPTGQPIRSIAGGRVVYADWVRGFGLVVIVDHGHKYLSLYGHARELLKETGDWVESGEALGTVGDSGGQSKSGLYFEIRRGARPQNPRRWCKGRPSDRSDNA
jgi:murein hydrolase activator